MCISDRVVDDAIVVVEAVQEHIDKGLNPRMASFAAMKAVSGPVIAIALVLAAVFLPSLLLEGITVTLFKQFAVTIAISIDVYKRQSSACSARGM